MDERKSILFRACSARFLRQFAKRFVICAYRAGSFFFISSIRSRQFCCGGAGGRAFAASATAFEIAISDLPSFSASSFSSSTMRRRSALTLASSPLSATAFFGTTSTVGSSAAIGSSLTKYPIATPAKSAAAMNI